ncbi:MAG: elongation factor P hydroxylase [Halioglobus sp.]
MGASASDLFDCARLESVFRHCFAESENIRLVGGAAEPLYQPAEDNRVMNLLFFREDYFASALHEISHWCIAGTERRRQLDFGYWYAPEGRNQQEQQAFESVEVKPQALEWYFSFACGYPFRISVDNFGVAGVAPDTSHFRHSVVTQAKAWQKTGLPARATQFFEALSEEFNARADIAKIHFDAEALA